MRLMLIAVLLMTATAMACSERSDGGTPVPDIQATVDAEEMAEHDEPDDSPVAEENEH